MAIIRWRENPFGELARFRREMDRLFDTGRWGVDGEEGLNVGWAPSVDLYEDEQNVVLTADIPGLGKKDVNVSVEDNRLVISGERKFENKDEQENYHRIERCYGSFSRTFALNPALDTEGISAKMDKGVLKITIPKKEEVKPKKIEIKA